MFDNMQWLAHSAQCQLTCSYVRREESLFSRLKIHVFDEGYSYIDMRSLGCNVAALYEKPSLILLCSLAWSCRFLPPNSCGSEPTLVVELVLVHPCHEWHMQYNINKHTHPHIVRILWICHMQHDVNVQNILDSYPIAEGTCWRGTRPRRYQTYTREKRRATNEIKKDVLRSYTAGTICGPS